MDNLMLAQVSAAAGAATAIAINALWESALLVACVWLLLRAWPGLNAATRYLVWSATLVATVVVPVATTLPFLVSPSAPSVVRDTAVRTPIPMVTHVLTAAPVFQPSHEQAASGAAAVQTGIAQTPSSLRLPERFRLTLPLPLALGVLAIWALIALAQLARLGVGLWKLEGLKRDALPLPVDYRDAMGRWSAANKGKRDVRLCVSTEIDVPVAVGLFDSMILIPRALLDRLSEEEVDQISLHELAHLRRNDDWSNGLQRVILALFAWNPAVLFVGRQLDLEREVACDDWVLGATHSVRPYALCLTKMAETSSWPYRPMPAPGVFATRKQISLRIERLLGVGRNAATNLALGPAAVTIAIFAALGFAMQLVAPSVAATTSAPAGAGTRYVVYELNAFTNHDMRVAQTAPSPAPKATQPAHAIAPAASAAPAHTAPLAKPAALKPPAAHAQPSPAVAPSAPPHATRIVKVGPISVHVPGVAVSTEPIDIDMPAMTIALPDTQIQTQRLEEMKSIRVGLHAVQLAQLGASSVKLCTGCTMTGVDWTGRDMRNVRYTGVDFSRAKLQGVNFSGGVFSGVDFTGANLRGVSFRGAKLVGCDFSKSDLTGADFTGANISGGDFSKTQLPGALLRSVLNSCTGCDFSHSNLAGQDLSNVRASGIDFSNANLANANLGGAQFTGTDFSKAVLTGANFNGTLLSGCDLGGVDLSHVDLSRAKLVGTDIGDERSH